MAACIEVQDKMKEASLNMKHLRCFFTALYLCVTMANLVDDRDSMDDAMTKALKLQLWQRGKVVT